MEKKVSIGKEIIKALFKTLAIILIIVLFAGLGFYVINPRLSAGFCHQLGLQKAEISCYELLYARNKDTSDLYNLIVKLGNVNEAQKQNDYITKLQSCETYCEFCKSMDESVISGYNAAQIEAKNLSLLYGTNEYLTSRKVINLIKLGKHEDAYNYAEGTFELVVYHYFEYLYASDVSEETKNDYFAKLKNDFWEYLEIKLNNLPNDATGATAIITAYAKLKIEYTQYVIALQSSPDDIGSSYDQWQSAQIEYNNLVK